MGLIVESAYPVAVPLVPVRLLAAVQAVPAGYPSPAQDYYDGPIDLTEMLVEDQAATFIVRASGHSMTGAGISDGDELLVDRSRTPRDGDVVVAVLAGVCCCVRRTRSIPTSWCRSSRSSSSGASRPTACTT